MKNLIFRDALMKKRVFMTALIAYWYCMPDKYQELFGRKSYDGGFVN